MDSGKRTRPLPLTSCVTLGKSLTFSGPEPIKWRAGLFILALLCRYESDLSFAVGKLSHRGAR